MGSFTSHCETTHNTMHYFHFIVSIWEQPCSEDNGTTFPSFVCMYVCMHICICLCTGCCTGIYSYVRHCLAVGDVRWFPIGVVSELMSDSKAVALTQTHTQAAVERPTSSRKAPAVASGSGGSGERMSSQSKDGSDSNLTLQLKKIQVQMKQLSQAKEDTEKDQDKDKDQEPPTASGVGAGEELLSSLQGFKSSLSSMLQRLDGLDHHQEDLVINGPPDSSSSSSSPIKQPPDPIVPSQSPLPTPEGAVKNVPFIRRVRHSSVNPSPSPSPSRPNPIPNPSPTPANPNPNRSPGLTTTSSKHSTQPRPHSAKTAVVDNSSRLGQVMEARQRPKTAGAFPKANLNPQNPNLGISPNSSPNLKLGPTLRDILSPSPPKDPAARSGLTVSGQRIVDEPSLKIFLAETKPADKNDTT